MSFKNAHDAPQGVLQSIESVLELLESFDGLLLTLLETGESPQREIYRIFWHPVSIACGIGSSPAHDTDLTWTATTGESPRSTTVRGRTCLRPPAYADERANTWLARKPDVALGGDAVAARGEPRFTDDLDVLAATKVANGRRLHRALRALGFDSVLPSPPGLLTRPSSVGGTSW
jgi:hypothetical protein